MAGIEQPENTAERLIRYAMKDQKIQALYRLAGVQRKIRLLPG